MSGTGEEEGYRGPLTVVAGGVRTTVEGHMAGHFDPLTGEYRWVGRLSPDSAVARAFEEGRTAVLLRTPGGHEGSGVLAGPNVWGGHTVSGSGRPPFALPRVAPEE
ncbi:DUF4873 domain-containing protein [Allosalinactinospora lopnorensis]|uniref:DUF4873 domain-containing protein n=1 Tax=Allosalinactinospora lopnorensis TaxID=1352348 RepID=UPI000623ECFC|nr:DUF4873 domain-containing protein [Allosalinactinospora lopnorensis]